jgi:hypothetical protein
VSLGGGATGERVEQRVVHVCKEVSTAPDWPYCRRESEDILGLLCMPGAISPPGHCLPALATTAKEEAIYPTRHPFSLHLGQ